MNEQEQATQRDLDLAYQWVFRFSQEVDALMSDAARMLTDLEFDFVSNATAYGAGLTSKDGPFVSYVSAAFRPKTSSDRSLIFSVLLNHPERRDGPQVICGCVHGTASDKNLPWVGWNACAVANLKNRYQMTKGDIRESTPTEIGRAKEPNVARVRWFELPIAWVGTPERLQQTVLAAAALYDAREELALAAISETRR